MKILYSQEQSFNDSSDNAIISFLSKKLIGKVFKFSVRVTSYNYNSSSARLTVTEIMGNPINIDEVQFQQINHLKILYLSIIIK